jgi:hypothetical protein
MSELARASASPSPAPAVEAAVNQEHEITSQVKSIESSDSGTEQADEPESIGTKPESQAERDEDDKSAAPPLPDEAAPPLPEEAPPLPEEAPPLPEGAPPTTAPEDDGWDFHWDDTYQNYYFYNRFTGARQWENPRVPETSAAPGTENETAQPAQPTEPTQPIAGGYNPAIHGNWDPTADYARQYQAQSEETTTAPTAEDITASYGATGAFNRFTGRWQAADINPENHNDEARSGRQMNAYFDVNAAANSHDGRSLRAERSARKPTRQEVQQYKEKRHKKKIDRRNAWLLD